MSTTTSIAWTNKTWNPLTGCLEVSPGCDHCYARELHNRRHRAYLAGKPMPAQYAQPFDVVQLLPERLREPFTWKKPQMIFVNSTSDLFHQDVPDEYIIRTIGAMAACPRHIYQVLTKRPDRLRRLLNRDETAQRVQEEFERWSPTTPLAWPLPNVWWGTSIELDRYTWRADKLRQVPAVVRFLSCEPLLGPLDSLDLDGIQWVIVGGESGAHIGKHPERHMDHAWARSIRDACLARNPPVAFFFKQSSGARPGMGEELIEADGTARLWREYPEVPASGQLVLPGVMA
jgi:protein gp37